MPHSLQAGSSTARPVPTAPRTAPTSAVALYAVVPVTGCEDDVLAELASYAKAQGWEVPDGCAVTDTGPLDQDTVLRLGWAQILEAADHRRIQGLVVPSFAHIAYHWADWNEERSRLLQRGLFLRATDPTDVPVDLELECRS